MKLLSPITAAVGLALLGIGITARVSPQRVESLISSLSPAPDIGTSERYTLVSGSIEDGNTFRVSDGKRELKVKLCGVETHHQEHLLGRAPINHLRTLMARGSGQIILVATDSSQPSHTVAEAFIPIADSEEEVHINSQMVADGMALVDPQSISSCPNAGPMRAAESNAKKAALGVWGNPTTATP